VAERVVSRYSLVRLKAAAINHLMHERVAHGGHAERYLHELAFGPGLMRDLNRLALQNKQENYWTLEDRVKEGRAGSRCMSCLVRRETERCAQPQPAVTMSA
jgi:hypothetical protein